MQFDQVPEAFRVPYVWLDGELVDTDKATISPMTYTLHYGLGVFEGIRAYRGESRSFVMQLHAHMARLHASASLCRMEIPFSAEVLSEAAVETLVQNGLPDGYIRPIAFVDDGQRGLAAMNNRVRVAITVWPWGAYLGDEGMKEGIDCCVSGWTRMNGKSLMPKGKICGQYVNSIMAKRDATLAGFHEGILLDDSGSVAEASGENLFCVRGKTLFTPPTSAPILDGITRACVIEIAGAEGFEVREESFGRDFLYASDEVFLTGTAAEVTPVRSIDRRPIGSGRRGDVTKRIQDVYLSSVRGQDARFESWVHGYDIAKS